MKLHPAWWLGFFSALLFFWGVATLGAGFDWVREYRLTIDAAQTAGVITAREPKNHNTAHYEFYVDGKRYQSQSPGQGHLQAGKKTTVYYIRDDPEFSTLEKPGNDLMFMIFGPIVLAVIAGFICMEKVKANENPRTEERGNEN